MWSRSSTPDTTPRSRVVVVHRCAAMVITLGMQIDGDDDRSQIRADQKGTR